MAAQSITFDFLTTGADRTASGFRKVADNTVLAAKGARVLSNAIETLGQKENRTAAESVLLAKALRQTGDAEDRVAARAVLADAAIRRLDDAMKDSAKSSQQLRKALGDMKLNPGLLGPALLLAPAMTTLAGAAAAAGAALGGAFIAGGAALAAFGAVAGPVLADAKKAATAAETAQTAHAAAVAKVAGQYQYAMSVAKTKAQRDAAYAAEQKGFSAAGLTQTAALSKAYEGMSPAQIALSKQLGGMADAWDKVKAAQTPVVAGALQPWLKSVTDLTRMLGPIIARVGPVIGSLGSQFEALVSSKAFTGFRDFIASTGSAAILAGGNLLIDFFQALVTLLPKFNPLIQQAVGWIGNLGPKLLTWASSQKTADHITAFMKWFHDNGPVVGGLLKSIGGALAALAPGLASGGALELKVISDFLNLVAKLPPAVAKPLAEVAGAALILSKMGVLKVGLQVVGPAVKWLSGGLINIGGGATAAGAMRAAMVSGGTAAAAEIRAAMVSGGTAAAAEEGAGVAAAGAGAGKAASGGFLAALAAAPGLPLIGGIIAGGLIKAAGDSLAPKGSVAGAASAGFQRTGAPGATITGGWVGALAQALGIGVTRAADSVDKATARIRADFTAQGKAATSAQSGIGVLTNSIVHNGNASGEAHSARAALTADMIKAGVNATTAQADVVAYSNAVTANGARSDQAKAARQRLITDILAASSNSRKGNTDLSAYTTAVQQHGIKSDAARGARQRLIGDLVNSGTDAKTATGLVDGLGTSIKNLPSGKTITINETGIGKFQVTGGSADFPIVKPVHRADGGLITGGIPGRDSVLAAVMPGEVIVPTRMVQAGAVDHLRGAIPGFAAGGYVTNYRGSIGGLGPWTTDNVAMAEGAFTDVMKRAMTAATKTAIAKAMANPFAGITGVPSGGPISPGVAAAQAFAKSIMWAYGWTMAQWPYLQQLWNLESGWRWNATNPSSGAYGIPQSYPAGKMASAGADWRTNPATQIRWGMGYIKQVYGTPQATMAQYYNHPGGVGSYALGGLIPGFASGGTVGQQGAAWLKAWQTRHGGGFGAAWGPTKLNQQIPEMAAAVRRARALSGAAGLSPGQHRFWAAAAADETRRLAVLGRELTTERAWRTQLGINELGLDKEIRAAGNLPSLAGPVRGWKAQLGRDKATVNAISRMLGYSDAYLAAHKPPPPGPVLPKITHTYGGDVANTLGAVLASALGPFTGARAGALVMDTGGTLRPGWQTVYNGTGRPESLVPARGGGGIHLHLTVNAPVGSQQQLEDWYVKTANKLAQHGRLTQAVRAASR